MYDIEETTLRIAKCIIGPRFDVPTRSPYTLDQIRDIKWKNAGKFERDDAINAAKSILRDMIVYPRKQRISHTAYANSMFKKNKVKKKAEENEQINNDKDGTLP